MEKQSAIIEKGDNVSEDIYEGGKLKLTRFYHGPDRRVIYHIEDEAGRFIQLRSGDARIIATKILDNLRTLPPQELRQPA